MSDGPQERRKRREFTLDSFPDLGDNPARQGEGPAGDERSEGKVPKTQLDRTAFEAQTTASNISWEDTTPERLQPSEDDQREIVAFIELQLCAPAPPDAAARGVIAIVDERYELKRKVGAGGMGAIFLAHDRRAQCEVAIKMIAPHLAGDEAKRGQFLDEAREMYSAPSHANVLVVKDIGDTERPYYVMEYMPGSLQELIEASGALDRDHAAALALDVARAVQYVHVQKGRMHRDVKPENILIAGDGSARLCDFGLVRAVGEGAQGLRSGTIVYMPPEVCGGDQKNVGFEWDIYSVGAVLYAMTVGKSPYADLLAHGQREGWGQRDLCRAIAEEPPPPIKAMNRDADDALVRVAEGAMARERRDRYSEIGDLVADLERVARGAPPLGPRQFERAGGSGLGTIAVVLVALGAIALGAWALWPEGGDDPAQVDPATIPGDDPIDRVEDDGVPTPVAPAVTSLLDATNPAHPFGLTVGTIDDARHFMEGDSIALIVEADREAYVYAFAVDLDLDDSTQMICPDLKYASRNHVRQGEPVRIPEQAADDWKAQMDPATQKYSRIRFKVLATERPIELNVTSGPVLTDVEARLRSDAPWTTSLTDLLGPTGWDAAEVEISTGPRDDP